MYMYTYTYMYAIMSIDISMSVIGLSASLLPSHTEVLCRMCVASVYNYAFAYGSEQTAHSFTMIDTNGWTLPVGAMS